MDLHAQHAIAPGQGLVDRKQTIAIGLAQQVVEFHTGKGVVADFDRNAVEARLTTGLPGNFNTETNLALARVAAGEQLGILALSDADRCRTPDGTGLRRLEFFVRQAATAAGSRESASGSSPVRGHGTTEGASGGPPAAFARRFRSSR